MSKPETSWRGALMDFVRLFTAEKDLPRKPVPGQDLFFGNPWREQLSASPAYKQFNRNPFAWVLDATKAAFLQRQRAKDQSRTTHLFTLSYVLTQYQMPNETTVNVNSIALRMLVECQPLEYTTDDVPLRCSDWLHAWNPPAKTYKNRNTEATHDHKFRLQSLSSLKTGTTMLSFLTVLEKYGSPVSVSALVAKCEYFAGNGVETSTVKAKCRTLYKDHFVGEFKTTKKTSDYHPLCYANEDVEYKLVLAMHKVVSKHINSMPEPVLVETCLMCQTIYFHVLVCNLCEWDDIKSCRDISILYMKIMDAQPYTLDVKKSDLSDEDLTSLVAMDIILRTRFHGLVGGLSAIMRYASVHAVVFCFCRGV